jgi:hypothetical protein
MTIRQRPERPALNVESLYADHVNRFGERSGANPRCGCAGLAYDEGCEVGEALWRLRESVKRNPGGGR